MKLRIATPMYGGQCSMCYVQSLIAALNMLRAEGINANITYLSNESLIPRARNKLARLFMESDDTHLLFWDADLGVNAEDLRHMLAYGELPQYAILGAAYPKKGIAWDQVRRALQLNPEIDATELAIAAGRYVVNTPTGSSCVGSNVEPAEVMEVGTGMMLIQRRVFEKFQQEFPELAYFPIDGDTGKPLNDADRAKPMWSYFESGVYRDCYGQEAAYLSEDFAFCQHWRCVPDGLNGSLGKVWLAPWVRTAHHGSIEFPGNFVSYANIIYTP